LPSSVEFARPDVPRSLLALLTSVVPFLALWFVMYEMLGISYLLVLLLAVPAAGFLVRTYILFHDCAHGSFLPWRRANDWLGSVLALLVFTPFARWRRDHVKHHATAGDLDRRGFGDVPTLTVAEYQARSWRGHLGYRLFRNPLIMFGLGPVYSLVIQPRWANRSEPTRIKRSTWTTNAALVLAIGGLCWLVGWQAFLLLEVPVIAIAGAGGLWLFYVQHQFEDTYWERSDEWSYEAAALRGSSYLRLPKILQFFTGSIGLHHVHHLHPKIPSYHLQRAHDTDPIYRGVPHVSLWRGLWAIRLKLWDEDAARLVGWADLRRRVRTRAVA
jgi:acyl-lipid omega-6 desaturase (Delta-12 desaturase)